MSKSATSHGAQDEEGVPLTTVPGVGATQNEHATSPAWSRCDDPHHRKLAICSVICGITCIGICALTKSVEAQREADPERAAALSKRAKRFGIISIAVWVSALALTPMLLMLVSYLLTLGD
ncbi:transmembrane protein 265-like [Spinachia spinachia]